MSLTSLSFMGIYFPVLLVIYYNPIIKNNLFRKIVLLTASLGLYTFCEPLYIILLLGVIFINYLFVKLADMFNKNMFRIFAIVIDVSILLLFKYVNKFIALGFFSQQIGKILFPIGLSYYIFKSISYVVDSKYENQGNFLDVAIYISNFLTIVSGPLSTYKDELPTIKEKKLITFGLACKGFERLIIGLGKKIIIADSLGVLVSQCFASSELSVLMSWGGAIAYTLQLYFDFSGYTDIAIGIGYLFGFSLPENFNYPYMADSISDFWRRWHISLTKWFTNYIYIPLGGSRVESAIRHIFNLFVVWFITGIWHGSSFTFIIWAMVYFILQMLEKYTHFNKVLKSMHVEHIYVMLVVIIEWVIFRSESFLYALKYIGCMFGLSNNNLFAIDEFGTLTKYIIPFVLGFIFSTNIGVKIKNIILKKKVAHFIYNFGLILTLILCIVISISKGYSSPLYAGF